MASTTKDDMLDPQILVDAVQAEFKGKTAFVGSGLASSGAVMVEGTMPKSGAGAIGKTVDIPYFGTIGAFASNPDGSSVTPTKLGQTSEQATVTRESLAVETSVWAQGVGKVGDGALGDPYAEGARQAMVQATLAMDRQIVTEFATTPLVKDDYVSGSPVFISYQGMTRARTLWGDSQDGIVAMVTHSQAEADLANYSDTQGRPLLTDMVDGVTGLKKFNGIPLVISDRGPLTGSTMGAVNSVGTTPPVATITGTPKGAYDLRIKCTTLGAHLTAQYQFSVDGGNTWSAVITTLGVGVAQALTDTATDSLVGENGETGLSVAFAAGTFAVDQRWGATANLAVSSLIVQAGAGAFWYNRQALSPQTDKDILADSDIIAMHLYAAPHLYRRRPGSSSNRPGVVRYRHNVSAYTGQAVADATLSAIA